MGAAKETLYQLADWDIKTINTFNKYLAESAHIPLSKTFLNTMIKFDDMYQPFWENPYSLRTMLGEIHAENEYRRLKKAQIYLNRKDLVKITDGRNGKKLVLTSRARRIFYEEFPLAKLRKERWGGSWTIAMYDFPERKRVLRNIIRNKLKSLGFGQPQESLLVSPLPLARPVQQLIEGEEINEFVWVLTARRVLGLSNREVAQRAWNLAELDDLYAKLLTVLPKAKRKKEGDLLKEWQRCFLAVDAADPYLPFELLPEDWSGENCRRAFRKSDLRELLRNIFI